MATTNIFMNSYKQKENKLTYNFLCLLEYMEGFKEFCEYLIDKRVPLADCPPVEIETQPSGGQSRPDGKICVKGRNKEEYTIYIENKTGTVLHEKQLSNHLSSFCQDDKSFLLVTTPRITDKLIIKKVGSKKVFFKTWSEIANKLKEIDKSISSPSFVISQFIQYGELSEEFYDMEHITKEEIDFYTKTIQSQVEKKMRHVFGRLRTKPDLEEYLKKYGFKAIESEVKKHWGRFGIEFGFTPRKDYGQWFFFGIYFDTTDHGLKFKKPNTPELALFFDYDPKHRKTLERNTEFIHSLENLCKKDFEHNLGENLANKWRLVFWRKPLTEIGDFSYENLKKIFEDKLSLLCEEDAFAKEML